MAILPRGGDDIVVKLLIAALLILSAVGVAYAISLILSGFGIL